MIEQAYPQPALSPLQQRAMALRQSLDEALQVGRTAPSGAAPSPGPPSPGAQGPQGPLGAMNPPPGGPTPLPQRIPSSPIMGALQQSQAQRPEMTPQQPMAVKPFPNPASNAQRSGPIGFAAGGRVDFACLKGR